MLGARALLAFQRNETIDGKPDGDPSEDALLGAIMTAEHQLAGIQTLELLGEWAKSWAQNKRQRARQR